MLTKICKKCGKELPITEFGNNPMSKDGHINTCKRCRTGFPKKEILIVLSVIEIYIIKN